MKKTIKSTWLYLIAIILASPFALADRALAVPTVFTEYSIGARAQSIVGGPDGALWFTSIASGGAIGRTTTAGVTSLYPTASFLPPSSSAPKDITLGPDGALWFTVPAASSALSGSIGKITTAGIITSYPLTNQMSPSSIVTGQDNKLWYTQSNGTGSSGSIGNITTGGYITNFSYSSAYPNLNGIARGRDGALWFAETAGNSNSTGPAIGRITTGGYVSRYPVPAPTALSAGPVGICAGPDGNIWYTSGSGVVGKITMTGSITEYAIPSGSPIDITPGPDGHLWIVMNDTNRIGQVDTSGVLTQFDIPTPSSDPLGITFGSDGAVWFTEYSSYKISKLTTPTQIEEFSTTSRPTRLITGSDGAMWYASHDNKINRVGSSGTVTNSYSITSVGIPGDMTLGPDGAIWFAAGAKIGRLTTAGSLSSFTLPSGYTATKITLGSDGALWIIGAVPGSSMAGISRMTTSGSVTNYPMPSSVISPVEAITNGPDGAIWFIENAGGNSNFAANDSSINRLDPLTGAVTRNIIPPAPGIKPWPRHLVVGPDGNLWFTLASQATIVKMDTSGTFTQYIVPVSDIRNLTVGADGALWYALGTSTNKIGRTTVGGVSTTLAVLSPSSDIRGIVQGSGGTMWYGGYSSSKIGKITLP